MAARWRPGGCRGAVEAHSSDRTCSVDIPLPLPELIYVTLGAVGVQPDHLDDLAYAIMHEFTRMAYRVNEDDVTRARNQVGGNTHTGGDVMPSSGASFVPC